MTTRTITGLYDSYDAAAQTVRDLEAAHIPDTDISMVAHRSDAHDVPSDSAHGATAGAGTGASAGAAIGGGVVCLPVWGCSPSLALVRWWPPDGWLRLRSVLSQAPQRVAPRAA